MEPIVFDEVSFTQKLQALIDAFTRLSVLNQEDNVAIRAATSEIIENYDIVNQEMIRVNDVADEESRNGFIMIRTLYGPLIEMFRSVHVPVNINPNAQSPIYVTEFCHTITDAVSRWTEGYQQTDAFVNEFHDLSEQYSRIDLNLIDKKSADILLIFKFIIDTVNSQEKRIYTDFTLFEEGFRDVLDKA